MKKYPVAYGSGWVLDTHWCVRKMTRKQALAWITAEARRENMRSGLVWHPVVTLVDESHFRVSLGGQYENN